MAALQQQLEILDSFGSEIWVRKRYINVRSPIDYFDLKTFNQTYFGSCKRKKKKALHTVPVYHEVSVTEHTEVNITLKYTRWQHWNYDLIIFLYCNLIT